MNDVRLDPYEAEQIVIGSLFLEPHLVKELSIQPDQLSNTRNSLILKAIYEMDERGKPIELAAFIDHVGEAALENIGGFTYLMEVSTSTPTTSNIRHYEQIVLERYQLRMAGTIGTKLAGGTLEINEGIRELQNVLEVGKEESDGRIQEGLKRLYEKVLSSSGGVSGVPSGYRDIDRITTGFQETDFIVIAARPSVGKTALATNLAANITRRKQPDGEWGPGAIVPIFSAEMSEDQLLTRMASAEARIDSKRINNALESFSPADWSKFSGAIDQMNRSDLRIFDKAPFYVSDIFREARKIRRENPTEKIIIVIDYLQLIRADGKFNSRREEVDEISRMMKVLAKDVKATVIALSQLSRGVEQRQDKRPMLSDLRESGGIEQDADMVWFLYRDDYYDKESEDRNTIEVIISKHRNGPTGTVKLAYIRDISKMLTIDWTGSGFD